MFSYAKNCMSQLGHTILRRLQRNTFRLPRRLQEVFAIGLPKTSSRRLQDVLPDVFKTFFQDVFKTSSKRSSRRLQDVFARRLAIMSSRRLQDVLEDKKNVTLKTSSVRLDQDQCLLRSFKIMR